MAKRLSLDGRSLHWALAFALLMLSGLAVSRLIYEAAFPNLLLLARIGPVLLLALIWSLVGLLLFYLGGKRLADKAGPARRQTLSVWALTPLLLNIVWLASPNVELVASRFSFAASLWLVLLFAVYSLYNDGNWHRVGSFFIAAALLPLYLLTIPQAVGIADTFEFQVVVPQLGIAHPTGYPLYILLGRLFSFIPWGSMAWRINLASAVFALAAVLLIYDAGLRLLKRPLPVLLAAVLLGLTPVYWSQAIEAEVYALHALFVAGALWLMVLILDTEKDEQKCENTLASKPSRLDWSGLILLLAFLLGLGLTNHLTTLFLLPPALLAVLFAFGPCLRRQNRRDNLKLAFKAALLFLIPLLLYAYLPIRWLAIHGEGMGFVRFLDWVIGGRFQGALQLNAWLSDLTRYEVVGRLLLQNWGPLNLVLATAGLVYLFLIHWRAALVLLLTWLGFVFYALNYIVPDLAVFLIPAHVVTALFWAAGVNGVLVLLSYFVLRWSKPIWLMPLTFVLLSLLILPTLLRLSGSWPAPAVARERLQTWGQGVLALPLDQEAVILADSEKIAPLYYLQQAEGLRPDLDIMVLPDEAAYRAELDARIASGQTVYLARFLPGLEGIYHLRSFGPLIEVSTKALTELPPGVIPQEQDVGPLSLVGTRIEEPASIDPRSTAVTLYWQAAGPTREPSTIFLRWVGNNYTGEPDVKSGQYPAANYYPVPAWRDDEIVSDFHLLAHPILKSEQQLELQAAVGPPFSSPAELDWQTITTLNLEPMADVLLEKPLRAQNGRVLVSGADFPAGIRPQTPLPVVVSGYGSAAGALNFSLKPLNDPLTNHKGAVSAGRSPAFVRSVEVSTNWPNGRYQLVSEDPQGAAICSWLAAPSSGCILGEVMISGVPLPEGATNFEDKIALLDIDLPDQQITPGGELPVNLRWQALSAMAEDYTVFLQVLDGQDRIVGQVDAWPLQGTYPTSEWSPGEIIDDPYLIRLDADLPPGSYRLQIGWYLLATLRRLPIVDAEGLPVDDKVIVSGFSAP